MVFSTLLYIAPETIVYDNCCNLHNYCLNREPEFFRNSQFLIDRFHWSNHIGSYNKCLCKIIKMNP